MPIGRPVGLRADMLHPIRTHQTACSRPGIGYTHPDGEPVARGVVQVLAGPCDLWQGEDARQPKQTGEEAGQ